MKKELTLDEKLDKILHQQKKIRNLQIFRMVFGFVVFLLVVVAPIYGLIWFGNYFTNDLGLDPQLFLDSVGEVDELIQLNQSFRL